MTRCSPTPLTRASFCGCPLSHPRDQWPPTPMTRGLEAMSKMADRSTLRWPQYKTCAKPCGHGMELLPEHMCNGNGHALIATNKRSANHMVHNVRVYHAAIHASCNDKGPALSNWFLTHHGEVCGRTIQLVPYTPRGGLWARSICRRAASGARSGYRSTRHRSLGQTRKTEREASEARAGEGK
jgi:hypothetical protein